MEQAEILRERYALVMGRIREIPEEHLENKKLESFFHFCAGFLIMIDDMNDFLAAGGLYTASAEELQERNHALYADILPDHYDKSYGNPVFAVTELGEETGRLLCLLYGELRSLAGFVHESSLEDMVIRMEVFAEAYGLFRAGWEGSGMCQADALRSILYWYASDYSEISAERRIGQQVCAEECFGAGIIRDSDLTDTRYLYAYGEYIGEQERKLAEYMAGLSAGEIEQLAEGGREVLTAVSRFRERIPGAEPVIELRYQIGLERVLRRITEELEREGLRFTALRAGTGILDRGTAEGGFRGSVPNIQYVYDHREDEAVFLDGNYTNRKLEALRAACVKYRASASGYCGYGRAEIRVPEAFLSEASAPAPKRDVLRFSGKQKRLWEDYLAGAEELRKQFFPGENSRLLKIMVAYRGVF